MADLLQVVGERKHGASLGVQSCLFHAQTASVPLLLPRPKSLRTCVRGEAGNTCGVKCSGIRCTPKGYRLAFTRYCYYQY